MRVVSIVVVCALLLACASATELHDKIAKSFLLKGSDLTAGKKNVLLELEEFDPIVIQHYTSFTPVAKHGSHHFRTEAEIMKRAEQIAGLRGDDLRGNKPATKITQEDALPRFVRVEAKRRRAQRALQHESEESSESTESSSQKENVHYEKHILPRISRADGQHFEDCMGCRLVWKQVEMDVANARYIEDVQNSFEHNAVDAQRSEIFYKVCEDMYDDVYKMMDDYMSGDYTADQMCLRARVCVPKPEGGESSEESSEESH